MRMLPQQEHCDLGINPNEDQTEDLRPGHENASGGVGAPAGGDSNYPTAK